MMRIIKNIALLITCSLAFGQSDPLITWTRIMKPKTGKQSQFVKAVATKTEKYNSQKGDEIIRTYRIMDGPNEGSFVRLGIPGPWSQFDSRSERQRAGTEYWMKNVSPHVEINKGRQFWSTSSDLAYNGTGNSGPVPFIMLRYYHIKPNTSFRNLATKVIETSKAINEDSRYAWYRLESGGDRSTWVFASAFDSFSELDAGNSAFWDAFEKRHGKGSMDKWFEEFGNTVQSNPKSRAAVIYEYRPDMSSPE